METAFTLLNYPISWIELIGTIAGLISVWLAVKNHVWTWPVGLLNVICFAVLFYHFRLYSDALLQVYFFGMSLYGWYFWQQKNGATASPIRVLDGQQRWLWAFIILAGTLVQGTLMSHVHTLLPTVFPEPAAFPYPDAFTTVASIIATFFLARRVLESWVLWVLVDLVSIVLYFSKGIVLVGMEYVVFLGLATAGGVGWYISWRATTDHGPVYN
ncbi:nicotinamide riboside transporter PnuC [Neolewinella persica]|uniref:nicotinamide riboside transporter PnuC n=1 Tax=Neolewinella persica TaxID=70998 RepID=UPI00036901DD|nr:nicotinamide riboside transporter PnuC [Neolewinella persica]